MQGNRNGICFSYMSFLFLCLKVEVYAKMTAGYANIITSGGNGNQGQNGANGRKGADSMHKVHGVNHDLSDDSY